MNPLSNALRTYAEGIARMSRSGAFGACEQAVADELRAMSLGLLTCAERAEQLAELARPRSARELTIVASRLAAGIPAENRTLLLAAAVGQLSDVLAGNGDDAFAVEFGAATLNVSEMVAGSTDPDRAAKIVASTIADAIAEAPDEAA